MFFAGIGTAVPSRRYTQKECWEALQQAAQFNSLNTRSRAILKKVLTSPNGIMTRHLALRDLADVFDVTPDTLQARFLEHGPALASQAGERALIDASISPVEIDAIIISTCTGYLCPGLTSYDGERLGLRPDVLLKNLHDDPRWDAFLRKVGLADDQLK